MFDKLFGRSKKAAEPVPAIQFGRYSDNNKTVEKTADIASTSVSRGAVILFLSMFVVIVNSGIALWLGDLMGKNYLGFFCVAAFYGVIGCVLYFFMHNWIKKRVSNSLISQMLK